MKSKLSDKASRFAKRALADFSERMIVMLSDMPLEESSVQKICNVCSYPRSTFYNYFDDIYDLMDYCWIVIEKYLNVKGEQNTEQIFSLLYGYLDQYRPQIYRILDLKVEPMFDEALKIFAERTTNILDFGCGTGYFDSDLTILSVSGMLLHSTGHTRDSFMEQTKGSLRNLFYGENVRFLEENRFPSIEGRGEGQILTSDGTPINVYLYKENTTDKNG